MGARNRALCMMVLVCLAPAGARGQGRTHYSVVALRVEFQPDTTRYTTGDGTFAGLQWGAGLDPKIDPLPHDAGYFEAHLAFLKDYVETVSSKRTTLTAYLVPQVVRMAQQMGAYSPVGPMADSDDERRKLARLVREAWTLADRADPGLPSGLHADSTFFLLFHAGIGRDVELLGTVLEKTPLDIPSLFLGEAQLRRYGITDISYGGLPVTHSAIVPRTESRLGYNSITQDSLLLELSINGLLASSFLSFLGVPDLFNTKTGESAIGGFGLMDPQGIFAYSGLFPPAPMAWTRQRLGWIEPQRLKGGGPTQVTLSAGEAARASVSEAEYFLIENRQRDLNDDGLVLRVWQNGQVVEQRIAGITDDFSRFSVAAFTGGVVVGVDDYDFALPGRDADSNQYAGGILIWHIDERVIATGSVNADPDRRGVDLEEADAAQDLGFGNTAGSPFDYFYEGNDVRVVLPSGRDIRFYENRFGPDTTPASVTNDGGESFISLADFSVPAPVMTFTYSMQPAHGLSLVSDVDLGVDIGTGGSVGGGDGFRFVFDGGAAPGVHVVSGDEVHRLAAHTRPVTRGAAITVLADHASEGLALKTYQMPGLELTDLRLLPAGLADYEAQSLAASADGAVHALVTSATESVVVTSNADGTILTRSLPPGGTSLAVAPESTVLVTGNTYVRTVDGEVLWTFDEGGQAAFALDGGEIWGALTVPGRPTVRILDRGQRSWEIDVSAYVANAALSAHITLADLNGDGMPEILTTAGVHLLAFTRGGAMVAGFPVALDADLTTQPLVTVRPDSAAVIWVAGRRGGVYALVGRQLLAGFPLAAGSSVLATPRVSTTRLEVVTASGMLRTFAIGDAGTVLWGARYQGSRNTRFAVEGAVTRPPAGARLLVASETYNWPNPVRHGSTFLRLMTREDAAINITVVDMAGTVLHQAATEVAGGSPAEIPWQAEVASGLYFARIQARSRDGRIDTRLIRLAVIR